jgi:hypothetical protein
MLWRVSSAARAMGSSFKRLFELEIYPQSRRDAI